MHTWHIRPLRPSGKDVRYIKYADTGRLWQQQYVQMYGTAPWLHLLCHTRLAVRSHRSLWGTTCRMIAKSHIFITNARLLACPEGSSRSSRSGTSIAQARVRAPKAAARPCQHRSKANMAILSEAVALQLQKGVLPQETPRARRYPARQWPRSATIRCSRAKRGSPKHSQGDAHGFPF